MESYWKVYLQTYIVAFRFLNIYFLRISYLSTLFTSFPSDTFSFLTPLMSQIPHNLVTSSSSIITVMYTFLLLLGEQTIWKQKCRRGFW